MYTWFVKRCCDIKVLLYKETNHILVMENILACLAAH